METVGNLKGVICSKQGKKLQDATIKELVYLGPVSTCSVLASDCKMDGKWEKIQTQYGYKKGDCKILFDINIKRLKGALFCVYFKKKEAATTAKNNGKKNEF